jgi:predicted nucleic acid-binding protein
MSYLLDTCAISELVSLAPNPKVLRWVDSIDEERLFLSVITIGEIKKGVEKLSDSTRKSALSEWLEDELLARFSGRLLPIDVEAVLVWGQLIAGLEKRGRPMPAIDSLIAATALKGGLTLVTRNDSDFAHCGVALFNPWTE